MQILNRWTNVVLYDAPEAQTVYRAVIEALKSGADLRRADLRRADLRRANLRRANLRRANLRRANLRRANLSDADLSDADLSGADLSGADLRRANLRRANLSDANLSDADLSDADLSGADLSGIPIVPNIDKAILSAIEAGGKLKMSDWHTCATTHCRAGWAITLAGEEGAKLEEHIGSAAAGSLIYAVSRPGKRVPDFYASDEDAMADIRAGARA